jgi:mRNA interferase MazF
MAERRFRRGEVWLAELPAGIGPHPVVLLSRDAAMAARRAAIVALVTSDRYGVRTEVAIGVEAGLEHDSVIDCDELHTVDTADLRRRRGALAPAALEHLERALHYALGLHT